MLTLKIGRGGIFTNYTPYLVEAGFHLSLRIFSYIDTLTFILNNKSGDLADSLFQGNDVIVEQTMNNLPSNHPAYGTKKIFAGLITEYRKRIVGLEIRYEVTCQDYTFLLHRTTFSLLRSQIYDRDMIRAAFEKAELSEINVDDDKVSRIYRHPVLDYVGTSLASLMDGLRSASGAVWYVSPDKDLYYHLFATRPSLLHLADKPSDVASGDIFANYYRPNYERRVSEFNVVEIRGLRRFSNDRAQVYHGNGTQKEFEIQRVPGAVGIYYVLTRGPSYLGDTSNLLDVYIDSGVVTSGTSNASTTRITVSNATNISEDAVLRIDSEHMLVTAKSGNTLTVTRGHYVTSKSAHSSSSKVYVQQSVTFNNNDAAIDQFVTIPNLAVLWNNDRATVLFRNPPPNNTSAFILIGRYISPIYAKFTDDGLVAAAGGRKFTYVINDPNIIQPEEANEVAKAFIREQGPKEILELFTNTPGFNVGQVVKTTSKTLNITAREWLVMSMTLNVLGGNEIEYRLHLERNKALLNQLDVD